MAHCAHVSVDGTGDRKLHCWVSRIGSPAHCEYGVPFVLEPRSSGIYLISVCDSFDAASVNHLGTVCVRLDRKRGSDGTAVVQSRRWVLPTDGSSYYDRHLAADAVTLRFELQNMAVVDITDTVFVPADTEIGTEPASDDYARDTYPESRRFGGFDLATLERQWMLLFPGTIIPGEAGIPLNLTVGSVYARNYLRKSLDLARELRAETLEEKARVFCGVLSIDAVYTDERTDDTKPAQIFGGREDCDGLSISVAAMVEAAKNLSLWGLAADEGALVRFLKRKEVYLVAGVASPAAGRHEAHMWVMLYEAGKRPLFGEATSVHREQTHFEMAAYAWSQKRCLIFCTTPEEGARPVIGVPEAEMGSLKITATPEKCSAAYLLEMPISKSLRGVDTARFCHHVVDKPDEKYPNAGGRFSRYIRGGGFRDKGGYS